MLRCRLGMKKVVPLTEKEIHRFIAIEDAGGG
jgi:hypothetical protein